MQPIELKEQVRAAALELGFQQCGFAPAEAPAHADFYREWLGRGWHGEMGWLAREDSVRRRLAPGEALPGCRTLVVVSLSYASGGSRGPPAAGPPPEAADPLRPVVARYAMGPDYHDVFEERLAGLSDRIRELAPGARTLPYVDYGPVLERDHAQRAGLGWIGKNTVLIDPELGSWLLLGELLTTLELPPDEPFTADRCGTCTRCIEACPTDAIRDARELDARRCISYLTIELRGPIPVELRPLIGNRVFGCDICQEVCPWNREVPVFGDGPVGRAVPGRAVPPATMTAWAEELLEMDDEAFRRLYADTALDRPRREGLLRNLCVGLGNWLAGEEDPPEEALAVLVRALNDDRPLVRGHAAWALGEAGAGESGNGYVGEGSAELGREDGQSGRNVSAEPARALSTRLEVEEDDWVRAEIERALGR